MRDKSDEADESGLTDSIWAIVAGTAKALGLHIDYVLYDMSYANMQLYSASLPTYRKPDKDKADGGGEGKAKEPVINGDDPSNNDFLRKIIDES